MRFVVFLLSLVAALTAVGTLFLGTMAIFTDNPHDPKIAWGYALIVDAGLMIALGVVAAFLVWVTPRIAEKALWLGTFAGLAAMAIYGTIIFIARLSERARCADRDHVDPAERARAGHRCRRGGAVDALVRHPEDALTASCRNC